jgi:hypothetical protein
MDAAVGNTQATQTLNKYQGVWKDLLDKKSLTQEVGSLRNKYNPDLGYGKTFEI